MQRIEKDKTIAIAMSGGIDSSVAAILLAREGRKVIGITMRTNSFDNASFEQTILDIRKITQKFYIEHYIIDLSKEFNDIVIKDFISEYLKGRTPNPCVLCNKSIKFGLVLDKAREFGADYFATGHYARIRKDNKTGRFIISRGRDLQKDQSYMLWSLSQESLSRSLFPIGGMKKEEVCRFAEELDLPNTKKKESFELCFITDNNYVRFLTENIPDLKKRLSGGKILLNGKEVGRHEGYPFYTIGQRKRIGAYKKKMYVTSIDYERNIVNIGPESELKHKELIAGNINWVKISHIEKEIWAKAKVRYKDVPEDALVIPEKSDKIIVRFKNPKRAITPGQSIVAYDGNDILCGGIIEQVLD